MGKLFPPLKTIAIAHPDGRVSHELTQLISKLGYDVVAAVPDVERLIRVVHSLKPDLVLIHIQPPESYSFEIIELIAGLHTTAMVTLLNEPDTALALRSMDLGVCGYMVRPFDERIISATLDCSWHHFHAINALQETLELRRLLEKAKGVLMEQQHITEEQAHQTILKMSQDQGISLKELCHSVVQLKPILGNERLRKN